MKAPSDYSSLEEQLSSLFAEAPEVYSPDQKTLFERFREGLTLGLIRAAEPDTTKNSGWRVNEWVKKGILVGFRLGSIVEMGGTPGLPFIDKSTYPQRSFTTADGVRLVPGGSSVREGSYVARGVTCMPPMFINVGAYIDEGTMVDSHALIGSCAQIGRRCHVSAASQIGGVLEPIGALPVIIEDDVLVGGNCGVYEGTIVKRRAVLGSGTILTRSTPIYDLVTGAVHRATETEPLVVPEGAVVVAGSRPVNTGQGKAWGISLYTPVIVKYRDSATETRVQLEELLR